MLYFPFIHFNNFSSIDGERIGLVPINYIKLVNRNITSSPPISSATEPIKSTNNSTSIYESAFRELNEKKE